MSFSNAFLLTGTWVVVISATFDGVVTRDAESCSTDVHTPGVGAGPGCNNVFLLQKEFRMRGVRQDVGLASTVHQSLPLSAVVKHEPSKELAIMRNRTPTIFWWMLVKPGTYEVDLLHLHLSKKSLSGCDGFAVYSNVTIDKILGSNAVFGGKAWTGPMEVESESWWGFAMNKPIFTHVWRQVFADGNYRLYDWTVKLDADAVLVPEKLRSILRQRHPFPGAVFLTARPPYLLGALEVLSRDAVSAYAENPGLCETGVSSPREDDYLQKCLQMLNVRRIHDLEILEEQAGYGGGMGSGSLSAEKLWLCNTSKAAVHPVKDPGLWPVCFDACAGHRMDI